MNKEGTINLVGYGMTKGVFLDGVPLPSENGNFDWGYNNTGAEDLALAALKKVCTPDVSVNTKIRDFTATVISQIPHGNFDVVIKFQKWITADQHKGKKLHGYLFMDVNIGNGVSISKFIDFPNQNLYSGVFKSDTIEYQMVEKMTPDERSQFEEYLTTKTTRKDVGDPKKDVNAKLEIVDGIMYYSKGMGEVVEFEGHKADEYEH